MARRLGSEVPLEAAWRTAPRPVAEAPSTPSTSDPRATSKASKRAALFERHLTVREEGLSFAELRTASGLATEDLRAELDAALREGVIRRIGAGNSLRYLLNQGAPSGKDPGST